MVREVKDVFEREDMEGFKYIFRTVKGKSIFKIEIRRDEKQGVQVGTLFEYACGKFNCLIKLCNTSKQELVDLALKIQRGGG